MILNHEIYVKTWNLSHFNVILNLFFLLWQHDASTRRKTFWVILMWKDLLVWIVIKTFTFTYILVTDLATEMTTNQMISAVIDGATSLARRKLQSRINGWEKITSEKGFKFHQGKKKCLRDLSEGPRIDHYFLRGSANQRAPEKGEALLYFLIIAPFNTGDAIHQNPRSMFLTATCAPLLGLRITV